MRYVLLLFLFVNYSITFSHDQGKTHEVHLRIVVEAYKLLKLQFSKQENGFAVFDMLGNKIHEFTNN